MTTRSAARQARAFNRGLLLGLLGGIELTIVGICLGVLFF